MNDAEESNGEDFQKNKISHSQAHESLQLLKTYMESEVLLPQHHACLGMIEKRIEGKMRESTSKTYYSL